MIFKVPTEQQETVNYLCSFAFRSYNKQRSEIETATATTTTTTTTTTTKLYYSGRKRRVEVLAPVPFLFNRFINFVNSFHPVLKLKSEISEASITFLDINISVQDNKATSVHYKSQVRFAQLLTVLIFPPISRQRLNSIYSQFLRLRRLCSDDSDFNSRCGKMSNFFSERGYPDSILSKALNRVQNVNR